MSTILERSHVQEVQELDTAVSDNRWTGISLATIFGLGVALRFAATSPSFPAGDGGLFFGVVEAVERSATWPHQFLYSGVHLTFAYPPFGFYLIAALHNLFGLSNLSLFEYVPFAVSCLSIGAFALLARALTSGRLAMVVATAAYAFSADTLRWEVKGGGITRSFGELFAILAIHQFIGLYRTQEPRRILPAGVLLALVLLSHPEWSMFAAVSLIVTFLFFARSRQGLILTVASGTVTVLLVGSWLLPIALRDGLRPFSAVMGNNSDLLPWYLGVFKFLILNLTDSPGFPVIPALGLFGLMLAILRRQWYLPVWLIALYAAVTRGTSQEVVIVMALLAGSGASWFWAQARALATSLSWARTVSVVTAAFLALYALFMSYGSITIIEHLSRSDRSAMAWVAGHTPLDARFLVVTGSPWYSDAVAEWFPVLAGRVSLATVQGYEWIPHGFTPQYKRNVDLQHCAARDAACLQHWAAHFHQHFTYVLVQRGPVQESGQTTDCCWTLRTSLDVSPHFHRVFTTTDAVIYRRG